MRTSSARPLFAMAALAAFAMLSGCKRASTESAPEPPAGASSALAQASASASSAQKASPTASALASVAQASPTASASAAPSPSASAGPAPLTAEEKAVAAAYLRALARGRKETRAKKYPEAVAAFGEALEKRPGDAQALAERGYARLLAGEHDKARDDLEAARRKAGAPELISQILHNLGLIEEAKGNAAAGKDLKEQAKTLRALAKQSKDAAKCPALTTRPGEKGEIVDDWKAILKRVKEDHQKRFDEPYSSKLAPSASDDEIRRVLTGSSDGAASAWLIAVDVPDGLHGVWHAAAKRGDGKLALFLGLAERHISRCPSGPQSASIEVDVMPRVIIDEEWDNLGYMCQYKNDKFAPCGDDGDGEPVQSFCSLESYVQRTIFLDPEAPDLPLAVEERSPEGNPLQPGRIKVVPQKDKVMVVGAGCNFTEPFRP